MSQKSKRPEQKVAPGVVIFDEGQPGDFMYLIREGKVEISQRRGEGREVLVVLAKGSFFGELALIDNEPRSARARALEETVVVPISRKEFDARVERSDPVVRAVLRAVTRLARDADAKRPTRG